MVTSIRMYSKRVFLATRLPTLFPDGSGEEANVLPSIFACVVQDGLDIMDDNDAECKVSVHRINSDCMKLYPR